MVLEDIKFQSLREYLTKTNPNLERQEAVYRLTFENGKQYVGQSVDVLQRLEEHLIAIESARNIQYRDAARDNGLSYMPIYELLKHIKIEVFPCSNSIDGEALILLNARENNQQPLYYNKQFYSPRRLGKQYESKGRDSSVIF